MKHYDALETRSPQEREAALMAALPAQIANAQKNSAAFAEILKGVDAAGITSRAALAKLPVTRKYELLARQQAQRATDPFGGFATIGWKGLVRTSGARRVYQSPGPIYEPEGAATDYWRAGRAMAAAGFEAGDLVHNCFSYHLTPGAWIMESGAHALGCTVIPGGVGNTEQQLAAVADLRPVGYAGTPSFLKILIEKAAEAGQKLSITKALVSGEACPPSLRDWFTAQGVAAYQCYATADVGLIAYETSAREGLVLDEGVIVEIVRPGTGFNIVKDLNEKEKVTFLIAEQNTNMALKYADYGYIMESGRIVMDGEAEYLRTNEDVKEFYLGVGGGERKSFKDVKSYKRRKRWLA